MALPARCCLIPLVSRPAVWIAPHLGLGYPNTVVVASDELRCQLAQRFRAASPASDLASPTGDPDTLGTVLGEIVERGRLAWPELGVDVEGFVQHLARKTSGASVPASLHQRHIEDLYLAYACAGGQPAALAAFGRAYDREIVAASAKLGGAAAIAEVKQQLYQKLFVTGAGEPRILDYSGQGPLAGWLKVILARAIIDQHRAAARSPQPLADDKVLAVPSLNDDPETEYLKRKYRHEFREAFENAVASLGPEERNVLRFHYAKRLSIDEIAGILGMHRATAARRVNRARDSLLAETRRQLAQKLQLTGTELQSVLRLIESQVHVSVERLLG